MLLLLQSNKTTWFTTKINENIWTTTKTSWLTYIRQWSWIFIFNKIPRERYIDFYSVFFSFCSCSGFCFDFSSYKFFFCRFYLFVYADVNKKSSYIPNKLVWSSMLTVGCISGWYVCYVLFYFRFAINRYSYKFCNTVRVVLLITLTLFCALPPQSYLFIFSSHKCKTVKKDKLLIN